LKTAERDRMHLSTKSNICTWMSRPVVKARSDKFTLVIKKYQSRAVVGRTEFFKIATRSFALKVSASSKLHRQQKHKPEVSNESSVTTT